MDNEKDLLKKDLATLEKQDEIEKFAEDAELMGHPDIANLAKEKLASLQSVAQNIETVTPAQVASVENLGGSGEVLAEKTQEVDKKIEEVKEEAGKEITEIAQNNTEKKQSSEPLNITIYEKNIKLLEEQVLTLEKWKEYFSNNPAGNELMEKSPYSNKMNFIERTQKLKTLLYEYIPLMQKYRNSELRDEAQKDSKYQKLSNDIYSSRVQFEGQHDPSIETNWNSNAEGHIAYAEVYMNNLPLINSEGTIPLSKLLDLSIEDKKKQIEVNVKNLKEENNNESTSFLTEKGKEDKFDAFKSEFEKYYKEEPKQEYSIDNLKNSIVATKSNPKAVNDLLESLPKDVIDQIRNDNYSISAGAISSWQNSVGGHIGKLSNERVNVYNKSGGVIGTAASNSEEYLATVANASRFVPKEVSEKFVKDALNNFTNEDARNSTGARLIIATSEGKIFRNNIIRNLVEGGYSNEVKSFLSSEAKNRQIEPSEIFAYYKKGLFSENDVKDILDKAGLLEDPKKEEENSKWG